MSSRIGTTLTQQALEAAFGSRPFTLDEAAQHGVTRRRVQCAVDAGKVTHLRHRLYVATEITARGSLLALRQRLAGRGIEAVIAGQSAAEVWGIPILGQRGPLPPGLPSVGVPPSTARPGSRGGVRYLVGELPRDHVVTLGDGLVLTAPFARPLTS